MSCLDLQLEELAAGAIIILSENDQPPYISWKKLYYYGVAVVDQLRIANPERDVLYRCTKNDYAAFIKSYSDYFEEVRGGEFIGLHKEKDINDLWALLFMLEADERQAFLSPEARSVIVSHQCQCGGNCHNAIDNNSGENEDD